MEILWALSEVRVPFLDAVFGAVTRLGEEFVAIAAVCLIYWCISKRMAYGLGMACFLSGLLVQGLKIGFRVERPWVLDPAFPPVKQALSHATGYSFPSGHTQNAASLFCTAGFFSRRPAERLLCFVAAALVGFSRLYLGVHTPADVFAAFGVAVAAAVLANRYLLREPAKNSAYTAFAAVICALSAAVALFAAVLKNSGLIAAGYLSDSVKSAGAAAGFAAGMAVERRFIGFSVKTRGLASQALKYALGMAGVMAIKEGLKLLLPAVPAADAFRYCLAMMWVTVLFPLIINKVFVRTGQSGHNFPAGAERGCAERR